MRRSKLLHRMLCLCLSIAIWLPACSPKVKTAPALTNTVPAQTATLNAIDTNSIEKTSLPSLAQIYPSPPSATPKPMLQLTYVAERITNIYSVYAITLGCPETIPPCLSDPVVLFDIPDPLIPIAASKLSWSPDGNTLVYDAWGEGEKMDIFKIDSDGRNRVNLTKSPEHDFYPTWSPNEDWISYASCTVEGCQVFRLKPDGTNRENLLIYANVNDPSEASWSPDGKQLIFTSTDENRFPTQVYVANLDGSSIVQVTHQDSNDSFTPAFSPDGRWIVFAREVPVPNSHGDRNQNVFLIKPDGSTEIWLAEGVWANQTFPSWSPLGDWITFNSYNYYEEEYDLYIIKSDGTHLTNVTNTPKLREGAPMWRVVVGP